MKIASLLKNILKPARPLSAAPPPVRLESRAVEKAFARLFATDDGQVVLAPLSMLTFMRAAGIDATDQALRYMEGQRALLAAILRLIERGRSAH